MSPDHPIPEWISLRIPLPGPQGDICEDVPIHSIVTAGS